MELFDYTNEYYATSSAQPNLPIPNYIPKLKETSFLTVKTINYVKFVPVKLNIGYSTNKKLDLHFNDIYLNKNPFMYNINMTEYQKSLQVITQLKSVTKVVKQQFNQQYRYFLVNTMKERQALITNMIDADITEQRGINPFLHRHDYLMDYVNFFSLNLKKSSTDRIIRLLRYIYVTQDIQIISTPSFIQTQEGQQILRTNDCVSQQVGQKEFKQLCYQTSGIELQQIINKTNATYPIYLAYVEQYDNAMVDVYKQWCITMILILGILKEGGTMIIKAKDLSSEKIPYFLYMCTICFREFSIEKDDENYSLFTNSFHIGCYGFKKNIGENFSLILLQSFETLILGVKAPFQKEIFLKDNDFEKEMVHFYSAMNGYMTQQRYLMEWVDSQIEQGRSAQEIAQNIIQDRKEAKETQIKMQIEKEKKIQQNQEFGRKGDSLQRDFSNKQIHPKVLNQVPIVKPIEANTLGSPSGEIRRIKQPANQKKDQQIQQVYDKDKEEQQKLAQLLEKLEKKDKDKIKQKNNRLK